MIEASLKNVSDFVINKVDDYYSLDGEGGQKDIQFATQLISALKRSELHDPELRGLYFTLYKPVTLSNERLPVAVKIMNYAGLLESAKRRMEATATNEELEELLNTPSDIFFEYKQYPLKLGDLDQSERIFLFLALEHKRYQKYFSPYIIPAIFVAYKRIQDHLSEQVYDIESNAGYRQLLLEMGKLTEDNREILARKGQIAFAMVQDFIELGPSVFKLDPSTLTQNQKDQLKDLTKKIQTVYDETGFFPDECMYNRGNKSQNLRFDSKGNLVLIDSNHLDHKDHVFGQSIHYLQYLKSLYS